jgi:hypothetical protein
MDPRLEQARFDGYASLLLEVQQECILWRKRAEALKEVAEFFARRETPDGYVDALTIVFSDDDGDYWETQRIKYQRRTPVQGGNDGNG